MTETIPIATSCVSNEPTVQANYSDGLFDLIFLPTHTLARVRLSRGALLAYLVPQKGSLKGKWGFGAA